jgi:hypothetical protein
MGGVSETTVRWENVHVAVIGMDNSASVPVQGMRFCRLSYIVESSLVHFTDDKARGELKPFTDGTVMSDE